MRRTASWTQWHTFGKRVDRCQPQHIIKGTHAAETLQKWQKLIRQGRKKCQEMDLAAKDAEIAALQAEVEVWKAQDTRTALGQVDEWEEGWDAAARTYERLERNRATFWCEY